MKSEMLCVNQKSPQAKSRVASEMDRLNSCRVEKRQQGKLYLSSISGRYKFSMHESCDDHWEVVK